MDSKVTSGIIFIVIGQLIALLVWLIFGKSFFLPMAAASIVGFLAGYRKPKSKQKKAKS